VTTMFDTRFLRVHRPLSDCLLVAVGFVCFASAGTLAVLSLNRGDSIASAAIALTVLVMTATAGITHLSSIRAQRRRLSFDIIQKIRFESPRYHEAIAAVRWRIVRGPYTRAASSEGSLIGTSEFRRADDELRYLVDFFQLMALALAHAALDEATMRQAFATDLWLVYGLVTEHVEKDERFVELRRIAQRWRVSATASIVE